MNAKANNCMERGHKQQLKEKQGIINSPLMMTNMLRDKKSSVVSYLTLRNFAYTL